MKGKKTDRFFLGIVITLVLVGLFLFTSASLGLLAREGASFLRVFAGQLFFGVFLGSIALIFFSNIDYKLWKKYSFYLFIASICITLLVHVPGLGVEIGGAKRWIYLGPISFQPAEFLKLGFVAYYAAILSLLKQKTHGRGGYGVLPSFLLIGVVVGILATQPDMGTFLVITTAAVAMFIAGGAHKKYVIGIVALALAGIISLGFFKDQVLYVTDNFFPSSYIKERLLTFLDPERDPYGAGYQIQQSLITIGSGQIGGRGFGQSIQKFNYLPEPIGDSIFAVIGEEWGFVGTMAIIFLFLLFAVRGINIARRAPDTFGGLFVLGLVILIVSQSFINMASMLGVFPLTGMPLLFISHGGTALFFALLEIGIILNISKFQR